MLGLGAVLYVSIQQHNNVYSTRQIGLGGCQSKLDSESLIRETDVTWCKPKDSLMDTPVLHIYL